MPLTNAEKQRRYRERLKNNPEKREEIRKKNLELRFPRGRVHWSRALPRQQREEEKKQEERQERNETEKEKRNKNRKNMRLRKLNDRYKKALSVIEKNNRTIATLRKRLFRQKKTAENKIEEQCQEIDKLKVRNEVLESTVKGIYKTSNQERKRLIKKITVNAAGRHNIHSRIFVAKCLGIARLRTYRNKFFIRDDITRTTAGKKECRTQSKQKQQIRYLTDTLKNLYEIYKSEGGTHSFSTFHRRKPFFQYYLLYALISLGLVERGTRLKDIITRIACDINSYDCMHGKCSDCMNIDLFMDSKNDEKVKWWQWQSQKHTYIKKDKSSGEEKEMHTRKTTKTIVTGTVSELIALFNKEMKLFKKHYFNMITQQSQYRKCLEQLKPDEVLLVCDYSENYNTKLSEEIQSMHFGASKNQVSLHCVMVYWSNKCQSICTVSDSLCHEPAAIWAHLLPVIKFIKEQTPNTKVLIYTPTNYFLLNLFAGKMNFDATWSFTESGHGKGVADGIGGSVKRCLDRQVLYGNDIKSADDVFTKINAAMKSVKTFFIPVQDIENMKKIIPTNLRPLPGNNDVHQIITTKTENEILHRPLSCFCGSMPETCTCYFPKRHSLALLSKVRQDQGFTG
ncbi:hypothetical protein ABMA28_009420 [Loxostege sticticalis]|uniref:Uncharacterized protein n=1 Tax=Loxostege sticticalis TaxID=481309 RepID=A0ABD0SH37_LOXSC